MKIRPLKRRKGVQQLQKAGNDESDQLAVMLSRRPSLRVCSVLSQDCLKYERTMLNKKNIWV